MKYTRDSGTTWNSFDPPKFEKGDLIEETSSDCASMKVTYIDGTTKIFTGLTSIEPDSNMHKAKSVEIYDGVTSIGNDTFYGSSSLTSITIPNSVTSIGDSAFYGCRKFTDITIPNSVTSIGVAAFDECSALVSVTLPNGLTKIDFNTFNSCRKLTGITIPDGVTEIRNYAFWHCESLTSFTIPNSVTSIGNGVFEGCSGLTTITVQPTTPPTLGTAAIPNTIQRIYVPAASVNSYKSATNWKDYADKIQAIP